MLGRHAAVGIFAGELVANTQVFLAQGTLPLTGSLLVSAGFATGNAIEALVGGALYKRWVGDHGPAEDAASAFGLVRVASVMSLFSAAAGISSLVAAGLLPVAIVPTVAATWYLGNLGGIALVAPLLLHARDGPMFQGMLVGERVVLLLVAFAMPLLVLTSVGDAGASSRLLLAAVALWAVFRAPPLGAAAIIWALALPTMAAFAAGAPTSQDLLTTAGILQLDAFIAGTAFLMVLAKGTIHSHQETVRLQDKIAVELTNQVAKRTAELESANHRLQAMIAHSAAGIITVDDDGIIIEANESAARLLCEGDDPVGRHLADCLGQSASDYRGGGRHDLVLMSGSVPVEVAWASWEAAGSKFHTAFIHDLSAQREAERERQAAIRHQAEVEDLRHRETFRTEFINQAAHELRTPLTPLLLQASVLERIESGLSPAGKRSVAAMSRNLKRLKRLVDDLLDIGRYESGHIDLQQERMALDGLVRDVVESRQESIKQAGLSISFDAEPVEVDIDGDRIAQLLHNLLSNAEKYTPRGGEVHVRVRKDMGGAAVRVADTGAGVSAEEMADLFEPFKRLEHSTEQPGTGLGLYVSRAIAQLHGGSLMAYSEGPGKGTEFVLRLPTPELVLAQ